jgi:hypothetical protein
MSITPQVSPAQKMAGSAREVATRSDGGAGGVIELSLEHNIAVRMRGQQEGNFSAGLPVKDNVN